MESYRDYLERKTSSHALEISALTLEAEPVIAMKAETEHIKEKLELEENIKSFSFPWSPAIREIRAALPHTFILNSITIDSCGSVEIKGTSQEIQGPALYRQNISDFALTGHTSLESVVMNPQGSYSFVIKTVFISPCEVTQDEN